MLVKTWDALKCQGLLEPLHKVQACALFNFYEFGPTRKEGYPLQLFMPDWSIEHIFFLNDIVNSKPIINLLMDNMPIKWSI